VKKALTGPTPEDAQKAVSAAVRASAMRDIKHMLLAGLGIGAAARGGYGIYNLLRRNVAPTRKPISGPVMTEIPYDERKRRKLASDEEPQEKQAFTDWFKRLMKGEESTQKTSIPWQLVGSMGAGAGGLYGGWSVMDMLLDRRRQQAKQDEVEQAKKEFERALVSQYKRPGKTAEDSSSLGVALDAVFDQVTEGKEGLEKAAASDISGQALNMYGLYGGTTALLAGLWMYNKAKKRQRRAGRRRSSHCRHCRRPWESKP
jgi:hypothetical protein